MPKRNSKVVKEAPSETVLQQRVHGLCEVMHACGVCSLKHDKSRAPRPECTVQIETEQVAKHLHPQHGAEEHE